MVSSFQHSFMWLYNLPFQLIHSNLCNLLQFLLTLVFRRLIKPFEMQMSHHQVVRMTHCERTTGDPQLLRDMVEYLGFRWLPQYRVVEYIRDFDQTYYRATVYIVDDAAENVVHTAVVVGSSVDLAVQQAAYYCLTVLRSEYYCFNNSPYRYVPCGAITDRGVHFSVYTSANNERNASLMATAQFAHNRDSAAEALAQELYTVRDQLYRTQCLLSTYTRQFVGDDQYTGFQLGPLYRQPDAGGYTLARGPLLRADPLAFGAQGLDARFFDPPTVRYPWRMNFRDRRFTHHRQCAPRHHPA